LILTIATGYFPQTPQTPHMQNPPVTQKKIGFCAEKTVIVPDPLLPKSAPV
jgi:hypothetical protein